MKGKRKAVKKKTDKRKASELEGKYDELDIDNVENPIGAAASIKRIRIVQNPTGATASIVINKDMEMGTGSSVDASQVAVEQGPKSSVNTREGSPNDSNKLSKSSKAPRRTRGPTRFKRFSTNGRIHIEFNEKGQPIGPNSIPYSTYLGTIARDICPISFLNWHEMPEDLKVKMWEKVQQEFIVPEQAKPLTLQIIGKCWREFKGRLRKKFYDIHDNDEARIANCPPHVKMEEWKAFVAINSKHEYMEKRERMKKIRDSNKLPHTCSRKGYARLENEMIQNSEDPSSITRSDVWTKAHKKQNGEPVNDWAKEKIEMINEAHSSITCGKDDALSQVLGVDTRGRVRGLGFGVSPSSLFAVEKSSARWRRLENELKILKEEVSSLHSMRGQILSLEANLAELKSQQGGSSLTNRVKCKLMSLWVPGDIVAHGYWCTDDPAIVVHNCSLGDGMSKVEIEVAVKGDAPLVRGNYELKTIKDAVGTFVAWPTTFIIKE